MNIKVLAEHYLEFLSLKEVCTGSSESTLVKMPHCCKSCVTAQLLSNSNITIALIRLSINAYKNSKFSGMAKLFACLVFFVVCWYFFNLINQHYFFTKYSYRNNDQSVKQLGSRSSPKFCRVWSGSKLFARIIIRGPHHTKGLKMVLVAPLMTLA